jgi:hypothetical protein
MKTEIHNDLKSVSKLYFSISAQQIIAHSNGQVVQCLAHSED